MKTSKNRGTYYSPFTFWGNVIREAIKITEKRMQDALPWGSAFFYAISNE